jgi:hypothetical protein
VPVIVDEQVPSPRDSDTAPTVKLPLPVMPPEVAVTVVVPVATAVAKPADVIVAAAVLLLDQVTDEVQLEVVPLE